MDGAAGWAFVALLVVVAVGVAVMLCRTGRCMIRAAADRPVAVDEALVRRAYEGAQRLAEQLEMLGMGEAAREVRGIREGVAALLGARR